MAKKVNDTLTKDDVRSDKRAKIVKKKADVKAEMERIADLLKQCLGKYCKNDALQDGRCSIHHLGNYR